MSTVGTTTFPIEGARNYFTLNSNEQYMRKLSIGSNWNGFAIGILASIEMTSSQAGLLSGSGLFMGMCSSVDGTGAGWKNYTLAHKMHGGIWGSAITRVGGFGTINPSYATDVSGSYVYSPSIGAITVTNGVPTPYVFSINFPFPTTENPPRIFPMQVNNNSGLLYYNALVGYTGLNNRAYTDSTLFGTFLGGNSIPADGNTIGGTSGLAASTDPNYPLDTVNIHWTGSVPLRIYQIAVARLI